MDGCKRFGELHLLVVLILRWRWFSADLTALLGTVDRPGDVMWAPMVRLSVVRLGLFSVLGG